MAYGKCKLRDDNHCLCSEHKKTARITLNGIIIVHRYNPSTVASG